MRSLVAGGTPVERLDRWIDVLIDLLAEHRTHARLLLRSLFEDDELTGELPEEREANETIRRVTAAGAALIKEGIAAGAFRPVSVGHMLQTLIGATVYHFASGDFGDEMIGRPVFSAAEVRRRKDEVKALLHRGLVTWDPGETR